jgi:hypothetical protein
MTSISYWIRRCPHRIRRIRGRPRWICHHPTRRSSGGGHLLPTGPAARPATRSGAPRQVDAFIWQILLGTAGARYGFAVLGLRLGGTVLLHGAASIHRAIATPQPRDATPRKRMGGRQRGATGLEVAAPTASCVDTTDDATRHLSAMKGRIQDGQPRSTPRLPSSHGGQVLQVRSEGPPRFLLPRPNPLPPLLPLGAPTTGVTNYTTAPAPAPAPASTPASAATAAAATSHGDWGPAHEAGGGDGFRPQLVRHGT